ncbi:MAG: beta-lactamase family protein [Bryobacterales bacterium]|nr:beta-lactamase family protein [Bryobacterales bacterium]
MSKLRAAVLLVVVVAAGVPLLVYVTAGRLHPSAAGIPSAIDSAPLPKWNGAVASARQLVRASLAEQNLPGLSVAVGAAGGLVWAEGFGFADLSSNTPVTPRHRFRIGSASTVLTAAAAGLLMEDGRLQLDSEIQTHVPEFPRKQWPVRLRHLMAHTAGLRPDGGDEGPLFTRQCGHPAEALTHFADGALLFEPGTGYRYSNYSWIPVSAAIESAARQPFLTFMRERVFDPLGMQDTGADADPAAEDDDFPLFNLFREKVYDPRTARGTVADRARHVTSYFPRFAADPRYGLHLMRPLNYSCYAGASVFVSTPSDLVRFALAVNSGKLLPRATVDLLQMPQRLASGKETGYGLGWEAETTMFAGRPARAVGHGGESLGGRVASLLTFPEQGIAVAVTSNISYADTSALAKSIAQSFASAAQE